MRVITLFQVIIVVAFLSAQSNIYDYKGGVRIPAGIGAIYNDRPGAIINSVNGGLKIYNPKDKIKVRVIYPLPLPEKAKVRKFVLVGHVNIGEIFAYIGAIEWNKPHQGTIYAPMSILPTTPYEIPSEKQKKVVKDLPPSGSSSLVIDRSQTYFIEIEFKSDSPVEANNALELFYIEIYWD